MERFMDVSPDGRFFWGSPSKARRLRSTNSPKGVNWQSFFDTAAEWCRETKDFLFAARELANSASDRRGLRR
jgi:hypothetical protein